MIRFFVPVKILSAGLFSFFSVIAIAKDCPDQYFLSLKIKSASKCEAQHNITVGSGIVSPSTISVFGENPAGLFYNQQLKVHLSASKLSDDFYDPWRYNVTVVTGDGDKGAGFGAYRYQFGDSATGYSYESTVLAYGAGIEIPALNMGIGISGFTVLEGITSLLGSADLSTFNPTIGILFNPKGVFRVGATVFDVFDEYRTVGFGMATFLGPIFSTALDVTASPSNFSNGFSDAEYTWVAKFGLGIALEAFQATLTYGDQFTEGNVLPALVESWNREGFSVGLAFAAGEKLKFNFYYNRLELYYFGLTVGL